VELFDAYAVSFISVTQAFNTTTSMGASKDGRRCRYYVPRRPIVAQRCRPSVVRARSKKEARTAARCQARPHPDATSNDQEAQHSGRRQSPDRKAHQAPFGIAQGRCSHASRY
jgi:hypothetical protein